MTHETSTRVAVVIPNWNGADVLPACLAALRDQTRPADEICIVDNGSTDGSAAAAAASDPEVRVVALPTNTGFANACNAGIEATTGDWVLVLNSDTRLEPEALERLAYVAATCADDVGSLQPLLLFDDEGERVNSTGVELRRNGAGHDRDFGLPMWAASAEGSVFGATGGAALFRRAMLEAVSVDGCPFDPTFFMYFEDLDLAWRAQLAGWSTRFLPEAVVHHGFQATSARRGAHFVAVQCMLNRVRCLAKNGSLHFWLGSARRTLGDLRWLSGRLGGQTLRRWVQALWDGLRQRSAVSRLARRSRASVEAAWLRPEPRRRPLRPR